MALSSVKRSYHWLGVVVHLYIYDFLCKSCKINTKVNCAHIQKFSKKRSLILIDSNLLQYEIIKVLIRQKIVEILKEVTSFH